MNKSMLLAALMLLAGAPSVLAEDWTRFRAKVRLSGQPGLHDVRVQGSPAGYTIWMPVSGQRPVPIRLRQSWGSLTYEGRSRSGLTDALGGGAPVRWSVVVDTPRRRRVGVRWGRGHLVHQRYDGERWRVATRRPFTLFLLDRRDPTLHLDPPQAGATQEEVAAVLKPRRPDELTIVYLNAGKGHNRDHLKPVRAGRARIDPLNANVRALARLRPDFLILTEVSRGETATLDPGTRRALNETYPGRLTVPSIWEFQETNNNAIYSRWRLVHVAGEERTERDGRIVSRHWSRPRPAVSDSTATVETRWLDWTPLAIDEDPTLDEVERARRVAEFKARYGGDSYNTRVHTRVDFVLQGQRCSLFPVHFAMPWMFVERTTVRDGHLVDGIQHHQLTVKGPLYHQIERARREYQRVGHGRVAILGDTNITRYPKASFPPIRTDPRATGDGQPARRTALAFELLARGYHDAFAGDDEAWSWPSRSTVDPRAFLLPRQLIDNCLHGAGFEVVDRRVFFPRGTDHGGLVIRLRLTKDGEQPKPPPVVPHIRDTDADTQPPLLVVTSPARGALVSSREVRVTGRVEDASGVEVLKVAGTRVPVRSDGTFSQVVPLKRGLNLIDLEVVDRVGNRARSWRSVSAGRRLPDARPVESALQVRLGPGAFRRASTLLTRALASQDLEGALKKQNPLVNHTASKWGASITVRVDARRASYGQPTLQVVPRKGGLRVRGAIPAIRIDLDVSGRVLGIPIGFSPQLTVRKAGVNALVRAVVAGGRVQTALRQTRVRLDGLHLDLGPLPGLWLQTLINDVVRDVVQDVLRKHLEQLVPPRLDALLTGAKAPIERVVVGRPVSVRLTPSRIAFDPGGATVGLSADVRVGGAKRSDRRVFLGTPGPSPASGSSAVSFSLNDDLLNRVSHEVWRAGALHLVLTSRNMVELGLPDWTRGIDAGTLRALFPEALEGVDSSTPLEISLEPTAAPVCQMQPNGDVQVGLGDAVVTLTAVPPDGPRRVVLRSAAQVLTRWRVSLSDTGRLELAPTGTPVVHADVFDSPIDPHKQLGLEALLEQLLPPAIRHLGGLWSGLNLPVHRDLRPQNVKVVMGGAAQDHLTVRGELR